MKHESTDRAFFSRNWIKVPMWNWKVSFPCLMLVLAMLLVVLSRHPPVAVTTRPGKAALGERRLFP